MAFFALMRFPVRFVNYLLSPTRFMISRRGADVDEDLRSYMTTPAYARRLREELADVGHRFICGHFSHLHGEPPLERIRETDTALPVILMSALRLSISTSAPRGTRTSSSASAS